MLFFIPQSDPKGFPQRIGRRSNFPLFFFSPFFFLQQQQAIDELFKEEEEVVEELLTAFDLHGALLRVVRVQMKVHRAGQNQRQPNVKMIERKKERNSICISSSSQREIY